MRDEGARTYYSIDWERFDGDLQGFLAYVERLRSAPPVPSDVSACATKSPAAKHRNASDRNHDD